MANDIEMLKRQLGDYRRLFDDAEVAITIINQDGHFIDCNKAYYSLMGYTDKPVLNHFHPSDISPEIQPDGRSSHEKANKMIQLALINGRNSFEWMHQKLDGYEFLSHVTLDVISFNDQDVVRATIHDISEQRMLDRIVKERTKELYVKNQELEYLAKTDPLTGLYNRIRLDEILNQELHRFKRYQHTFGGILIDLDDFKLINDTFGHQIGDQVLIEVSQVFKQHCREVDTVGRWGGEEFLIITPETDLNGVRVIAENLRRSIESHSFVQAADITASFGVAIFRKDDCINKFLTRIDNALYEAKDNGRNLVSSAK